MGEKTDIKALSHEELASVIHDAGLPMFRVKQIEQWLYQKGVTSFDAMTNVPSSVREQLSEMYLIGMPTLVAKQISIDGTRKYLFSFSDGTSVETVGIPSNDASRLTVCFSTQAGCAMGCRFCATGLNGFTRNLTAAEMYDQVRLVGEDFGVRVSNVVAMGQGEPFNNYNSTLAALRLMNNKSYLNIGARHITVSTCGVIKGIQRFSHEPEQFTLAISLHSAIQETRNLLMPGISSIPLDLLHDEIHLYGDQTKRRPTLEYAPIKGINDDDEHLDALVDFCHGMLCHVNLIPLNPVEDRKGTPGTMEPSNRIDYFESTLNKHGIEVSIRSSRGSDIDGACGQLHQKVVGPALS